MDAVDKVTGMAKYTADISARYPERKIVRSTIAHGRVLSIDTSEAEKVPGW